MRDINIIDTRIQQHLAARNATNTPENIAHHNWAIDILLDARHQAMTQDVDA